FGDGSRLARALDNPTVGRRIFAVCHPDVSRLLRANPGAYFGRLGKGIARLALMIMGWKEGGGFTECHVTARAARPLPVVELIRACIGLGMRPVSRRCFCC
ncbi:unnamed protein product, partial [Ectocarpus sp. 6 AP-2014]